MESIRVKDLMVPVEEYVTISETATLYEAVIKLEQAQRDYEEGKCPHRAILVLGTSGEVIGRMNKIDVIRSLEPKYVELGDLRKVSGFGLAPEFLKSMMEKFELWETPLNDLCRKAADRQGRGQWWPRLSKERSSTRRHIKQGRSSDHSRT